MIILLLFSLLSVHSQAQLPGGSWEMGWETEMETTLELALEEDWDLDDVLEFYVDNQQSTSLNLDMEYEVGEDVPLEISGPESITVAANSNETFEISITGGNAEDIRAFGADTSMNILVRATQSAGSAEVRTEEIEGDVIFPRILKLTPTLNEQNDELFAGSSVPVDLLVENFGNANDAISSAEASIRNCPHLSVTQLETLEDQVIPPTDISGSEGKTFELRLEASTSHQARSCEVTLTIYSEGDLSSHSTTVSVTVQSPTQNDDQPVFDDDEEQTSSDSESALPFLSFVEFIIFYCIAAYAYRRS